MTTQTQHGEPSRRIEALRWALSRDGDDHRWLKRHPDYGFLHVEIEAAPLRQLGDLLWEELPEIEQRANLRELKEQSEAPGAVAYWRRRYRAARTLEQDMLLATAPDLWRVLLRLAAHDVETLASLTGCELIAQAAAAGNREQANALLATVPKPQSREVRARVAHLEEFTHERISADLADAWRDPLLTRARRRPDARLPRWLGLCVLAALYQRLPDDQRAAARRHCRSDLCSILGRAAWSPPWSSTQLDEVEAALFGLLGRLPAGKKMGLPDRE